MGAFSELSSPHKKLHVHLLYCLLGIQFAYIVIDHFAYHNDPLLARGCNCPAPSSEMVKKVARKPAICKRREDFYEEGNSKLRREADPWHQMKWVGQPASCSVKGQLIEELDDELNFRRGYALRFVEDVEDKTHLLPWLLASKVNLNSRRRRVYLDVGANRFTTSVRWFLRMYPCDFTEIHAFEVNPRSWRPPKQGFNEGANLLHASNASLLVKQTPGIPQWMLDRVHIYYKYASHEDDESKRFVNLTRFIKEELKLKSSDTVVVKLDIEGSEWPILRAWMEDPEMPHIIDELFLEVHYAHPSMSAFGWDTFSPMSRQDAKRLLADLRWKGFYAHAWP